MGILNYYGAGDVRMHIDIATPSFAIVFKKSFICALPKNAPLEPFYL